MVGEEAEVWKRKSTMKLFPDSEDEPMLNDR